MKRSFGFTIIELMIVIAIIGILIASCGTLRMKHRDPVTDWRPHPVGPEYSGTKYECEHGRVVDHTSPRNGVAVYDANGKPVPCAPDGS